MMNLKKDNKLKFMKIEINDSSTDLNSTVKSLDILNSEIDLDTDLVYPEVFKKLESLIITGSIVTSISEDFFINFPKLNSFELDISNFEELLNKGTEWLRHLNNEVRVNLSDINDINKYKDRQMILELTDLNKAYAYPDKDFCLFRYFPHEKFVFPIIETKENLECSCTLMWLLKNKDLFTKGVDMLKTKSVENCLMSKDFDKIISNCDFSSKLNSCTEVVGPCTFYSNADQLIVNCDNFTSFSDLKFDSVKDVVQSISLKPSQLTLLDSKLNLYSVNFIDDYVINLENINGFTFSSNPFVNNRKLTKAVFYLKNSVFDFYENNKQIDYDTCNKINREVLFLSLFDDFDVVSLNEGITYPDEFCPIEFKNVNMQLFEMMNLKKDSNLSCKTCFTPLTVNFLFLSSSLSCATFITLTESSLSSGTGAGWGSSPAVFVASRGSGAALAVGNSSSSSDSSVPSSITASKKGPSSPSLSWPSPYDSCTVKSSRLTIASGTESGTPSLLCM